MVTFRMCNHRLDSTVQRFLSLFLIFTFYRCHSVRMLSTIVDYYGNGHAKSEADR